MLKFLHRFVDASSRTLNQIKPIVAKINSLEPEFEKLSDSQLKVRTQEFKNRLGAGESLDNILPQAFAAVREAAKRTIAQRHYDVQLMGGIVLHQGKIAEMKTGEGKTLVATLPLYLNGLAGKGAHLITVNDFLAKFHAQWMGPIYDALGASVAAIGHDQSWIYKPDVREIEDDTWKNLWPISRRDAYHADITYGTNNEFGFDYLRDNMAGSLPQLVQRDLQYGIVDEVDSILIDEARTPLIISAPAEQANTLYQTFARLVPRLKPVEDYDIDEKQRAVALKDSGIHKIEGWLGVKNLYTPEQVGLVHHLEEALKAEALFKRDKDYVVKDGEIVIVDEFTGRLLPGRRYSEGLHQAIEAKEAVEVKQESITLATISFQNLFRLYHKLAGMTGTAKTEEEEFYKIYGLEVVVVPTNRPMVRVDRQDQIYKTQAAKFKAVVGEVKKINKEGRPILLGAISIEKNEILSKLLKKEGVKHEVLNAKNHEREAKIIAQAGRKGAVTLATNIAGRGVDIILGGTPPEKSEIRNSKSETNSNDRNSKFKTEKDQAAGLTQLTRDKRTIEEWRKEHEEVATLGGLHVIGTERHESRRIDNQLRGRGGRQGDQGSTVFFVSMEDDLMRIFGGDRMKAMMERLGLPDDVPIENALVSKSIEQAQKKVEGHNFDIRKHLVEYDDVANKQREVIYRKRRLTLEGKGRLRSGEEVPLHGEVAELIGESLSQYEKKHKSWGQAGPSVEQAVYLRTIDSFWIDHLNHLDRLREGIGLRGYGQRDPLVEYKHEAFLLFEALLKAIEAEVVDVLMRVEIAQIAQNAQVAQVEEQPQFEQVPTEVGTIDRIEQAEHQQSDRTSTHGVGVTVRKKGEVVEEYSGGGIVGGPKVGRNAPCPCGSGKKYKKCHGK